MPARTHQTAAGSTHAADGSWSLDFRSDALINDRRSRTLEHGRELEPGSARHRGGFLTADHAGRGPTHVAGSQSRRAGPHSGGQGPRTDQPTTAELILGPRE